jgi:hypothetical protein
MSKAQGIANSANQGQFKNRIINGAMTVAQRGTSSLTVNTTPQFPVDRFVCDGSTSGKFTVQQNANSVTPPVGFTNYLGAISSSAYSVPTGEAYAISQPVEGFNCADLAWGTGNAATVTLSFWVRSSLTGTFGGVIRNNDSSRSYPFTYVVSSVNTWEQKSIIITGDTTGTWQTNNLTGIRITWSMGTGASLLGTSGTWASTNYYGATGQTNLIATSGATFYITGVQLEKGSTATSFDYRPYGTELSLCQRYCWLIGTSSSHPNATLTVGTSNFATASFKNPVTMRTAPTLTFTGFVGSGDGFTTMDDINYCNWNTFTGRLTTPEYCSIRATYQSGTQTSGNLYLQTGRVLLSSAEL